MLRSLHIYGSFLLIFFTCFMTAQTKIQWALWHNGNSCGREDTLLYKRDLIDKYNVYNYSKIWTCIDNIVVYGFIGDNYERLRIKFISVKKDSANPLMYNVFGKSMVKNNICNFQGKITITNIRCYKYFQVEAGEKPNTQGVLFGEYCFYEDSTQNYSGKFKGSFASCWFADKRGKVSYDSLTTVCDGYSNNQFAGTWTNYKGDITKTCNWGDFRIPFSKDFDIGTGEFHPNEKYKNNGWQAYQDNYGGDAELKKATRDAEKWWKDKTP